jgi:hypothetical protein
MYSPTRALFFSGLLFLSLTGISQVNSPFSRFGIGDLYNSRNVSSKAMGGIATAYTDQQSINFINPAAYSKIGFVTFDVGIETEVRTLTNADESESFQSANMIFNYATLGVPLLKNKKKNETLWGLAFGLRPVSRVRYNIQSFGRIGGIDSIQTEFRGTGGLYRGFLGTGFSVGGLSLGINAGYTFGQQDINTFRSLPNDSVFNYTANFNSKTSLNKFSVDAGMQYELKLSKKHLIRIGANGNLGGDIKAERDIISQTSFLNSTGTADSIDVVERSKVFGNYTLPASYTIGIAFETVNKFFLSAEYEQTKWTDFRNFGRSEQLADANMLRVGAQFIPQAIGSRNYFKTVAYRAGFFTGKDYVSAGGQQLPLWGVTIGAGLPVKRYNAYSTQFSTINTSFEYGRRGNSSTLFNENYFRINIGLALSDIWFIKRQYD